MFAVKTNLCQRSALTAHHERNLNMNQHCYIDRLHHLVGGCGAVLLAIAVGVGGMWVPLG